MAPRYKPQAPEAFDLPEGEAHTFDVEAFDDAIRSQGIMLEHWRAMKCPVGVVDKNDTLRRPHEHHEHCTNGYIYTRVGCFQALFTGNGLNKEFRDQGVVDSSQASMTFPRFYVDCCDQNGDPSRVYLAPYDRLYYADEKIFVPEWELVDAHASGVDRLNFPAVKVLDEIVDARGVRYGAGDFRLVAGKISWTGQNRPGIDAESGLGVVYSVSYLYRPHFYVARMLHEIRVTNVDDFATGERRVERMPQSAQVVREYVFLNGENDEPDSSSVRAARGPADGIFGAK